MIRLVIMGHARASVRITHKSKWTKAARTYLDWQAYVAEHCYQLARPVPWEHIRLRIDFYFATKRRPDLTNALKALEDGLVYGGLIKDDRAVVDTHARLFYVRLPAEERVEVEVEEA